MQIGIDIGGSHIACGIVENGYVLKKKERDFVREDKINIETAIKNTIKKYVLELLDECKINLSDIELMGIATPGNIKNGVIIKADNLGIENFEILDELKKIFDFQSIYVRNDAKSAALCEKEYGSLKDFNNAIFICLGTGIGGAVFMDGKLLKGKSYEAFELRTYNYTKRWNRLCMWVKRLL